jgi:hypothetical protein
MIATDFAVIAAEDPIIVKMERDIYLKPLAEIAAFFSQLVTRFK